MNSIHYTNLCPGTKLRLSAISGTKMFNSAFLKGMAMGGGLIVAIGAQNAFLLAAGRLPFHLLITF
ncbi:hypothetical protein [Janthinobacterium aquaticum]|uniref:hypothetical protein n=1 Tax=Janthinobacterium sp. FT58W TaxID=2654254 RepID=UPI00186AF7F3|nr:hypothetical protein [Janthinobacterium sp. FT58W]